MVKIAKNWHTGKFTWNEQHQLKLRTKPALSSSYIVCSRGYKIPTQLQHSILDNVEIIFLSPKLNRLSSSFHYAFVISYHINHNKAHSITYAHMYTSNGIPKHNMHT